MPKCENFSLICLTFIFILIFKSNAFAGDIPSEEIKLAAKQGLVKILKDKRNNGFHRLGFKNEAEIASANIGDGFKIYTIRPEKLLNVPTLQDVRALVSPTGQWQFTVLVGGTAYALLTVDFVDGKWTPVSIGASGLAKELRDILEAWPASSGYEYRMIRVYQASSNLVELSRGGKVHGIIPLSSFLMASTGEVHAFDPHDVRNPEEVLEGLVPVVKRNIEKNR